MLFDNMRPDRSSYDDTLFENHCKLDHPFLFQKHDLDKFHLQNIEIVSNLE